MDYFHSKQTFTPAKGDFLISEPYLPDPNFERTVVLLCAHGQEGSFGFILNKLANLQFDDVIKEVSEYPENLYIGGPVQQDTLHFIHRCDDPEVGGQDIGGGLFWGGNFDRVLQKIQLGLMPVNDFRFFVGYSGWDVGQLDEELEAKSWIVYKNAKANQVFDTDPSQLWQTALSELGGKFEMFSKYPTDPRMN
ncbi:YqgE/AlgH family protein [Reichenbachiella ulvae]|uniref:YqgE/AlgH family protein n=1 Tax=Reichenbachiella ulvae TaxID=2980104 RepID=A0ABT3CRX2_9BACT|nr:YqgE/AlgH family protein [Reichenbachiella ulvae]MCV9386362.1 YqgE/AlgH family protein [Reichenbachiella ulvae]